VKSQYSSLVVNFLVFPSGISTDMPLFTMMMNNQDNSFSDSDSLSYTDRSKILQSPQWCGTLQHLSPTHVYYEVIKPMYEYRCDERLNATDQGSTHLTYTGLNGGLEHLKIETRLINERDVVLVRMLSILDLNCEENVARP
jgi:hypothetical protein